MYTRRDKVEKETEFNLITKGQNPKHLLNNIIDEIDSITSTEAKLRVEVEEEKYATEKLKSKISQVKGKLEESKDKYKSSKENLKELLFEYKFESIYAVKNALIDETEREKLKDEIEFFEKEEKTLSAEIKTLKEKLDKKTVNLDEFLNLEKNKYKLAHDIDEITKEYYKLIGDNKVESLDFPSCACSLVKFYEDKIEYLILGDCTLLVNSKGRVETFKDDAISKLDKKVYDYMAKLENSKNMTFNERKANVMHIIIENRLKKNTIGGYWSLEFSKEAIDNCVSGFIDIKDNTKIMMTSDGFSCVYDRYGIFSKEDIIKLANTEGIDYIYKKVREFEKSDDNGVEYPRFKVHDDSSCVYLDIYK